MELTQLSDGEDATADDREPMVAAGRIVTRRNTSDSERGEVEDNVLAQPTWPKKSKGAFDYRVNRDVMLVASYISVS